MKLKVRDSRRQPDGRVKESDGQLRRVERKGREEERRTNDQNVVGSSKLPPSVESFGRRSSVSSLIGFDSLFPSEIEKGKVRGVRTRRVRSSSSTRLTGFCFACRGEDESVADLRI